MIARTLAALLALACGPGGGPAKPATDLDDTDLPADSTPADTGDDADADGVPADEDCDDDDPTVGPVALDADCDGTPDEDDCHPEDAAQTCVVRSLAVGTSHSCVVFDGGRVRCWGLNDQGQLGYGHVDAIGDNELPSAAGDVDVGGAVTQISTGYRHTCALLTSGQVRCWGDGTHAALGLGHTDTIGDNEKPSAAAPVDVGAPVRFVGAGKYHTCVLLDGGRVRCWGEAGVGQTGHGDTATVGDDESPSAVGDVALAGPAVQLAVGLTHTCALLADGSVSCWGDGDGGRLGHAVPDVVGDDETPAEVGPVPLGAKAVHLAAGGAHTCAVLVGGTVKCWGKGSYGRLGYGTIDNIGDNELPTAVGTAAGLTDAVSLALGGYTGMALRSDGSVRTWGRGEDGRLGYDGTEDVGDDEVPSGTVVLGGPVRRLAAGEHHACVVLDNAAESVRCWGLGASGRLGYGNTAAIGDDEDPADAGDVPYR